MLNIGTLDYYIPKKISTKPIQIQQKQPIII